MSMNFDLDELANFDTNSMDVSKAMQQLTKKREMGDRVATQAVKINMYVDDHNMLLKNKLKNIPLV